MLYLKSSCQKSNKQLLELFKDLGIKPISLKLSMKILGKLIQLIKNFGNFNINLYHNGECIICKNNTKISRSVSYDAGNYCQFCLMFSLKQIINSPTCINCRNTSLIDHILASIPSQILQDSVINVVYLTIDLSTIQEKLLKSKEELFKNK